MVAGLLTRYLSMYWLKPFDAVNDTANAWTLRQGRWDPPILEIGGGDGVFSFILHDGRFELADDRYDAVDEQRAGDMFDVGGPVPRVRRLASITYTAGVDLKASHLEKAKATGLYRSLLLAAPEPLPFAAKAFRTVFLYLPHGLVERGEHLDYERALKEIRRVLEPGGTLVMTAVNREIAGRFVCAPVARRLERLGWRRAAAYFRRLDAGREAEISGIGRAPEEWQRLLVRQGFVPVEMWSQVGAGAWRMYDLQTRPALRALIGGGRILKRLGVKKPVKALWMAAWLPVLLVVYFTVARPRRHHGDGARGAGMFLTLRAVAA